MPNEMPAGYVWGAPTDQPYTPEAMYKEVPEATTLLQKYTDIPKYFRLNRYAVNETITSAEITPSEWDERTGEPVPLPPGAVRTYRYCFPFDLGGRKEIEPPILAEHAAMVAAKAMTVRTMFGVDVVKKSQVFATAVTATGTGFLQIQSAVLALLGDGPVQIVCSPTRANLLLGRDYSKTAPNQYAGGELTVENTVMVVTEQKDGTPIQGQKYAWPANLVVVTRGPLLKYRFLKHNPAQDEREFRAVHRELNYPPDARPDRDIVERMAVETKTGSDGLKARIIEDYRAEMVDPSNALAIVW